MITDTTFETVSDFTDVLIEHYNTNETFVVVCGYEMAAAIFKDIMKWDSNVEPVSIQLEHPYLGGYTDEYMISFVGTELFVNPLRFEGGALPKFLADDENYTYFEASVTAEVLDIATDNLMIFSIDEVEGA